MLLMAGGHQKPSPAHSKFGKVSVECNYLLCIPMKFSLLFRIGWSKTQQNVATWNGRRACKRPAVVVQKKVQS